MIEKIKHLIWRMFRRPVKSKNICQKCHDKAYFDSQKPVWTSYDDSRWERGFCVCPFRIVNTTRPDEKERYCSIYDRPLNDCPYRLEHLMEIGR